MKTLLVFMLAIAVLLFVDALPYVPSKPSKITIPLKKKPITSRRSRKLDRRLSESLRILQQEPDVAYYGELIFGHASGGGEGQSFNIQFDTGSADLWVMSVACDSPACQEQDSLYNRDADTDFQDLDKNFGIKYQDGDGVTGISASTIVQIGDYSSRQDIGYVETANMPQDSPFTGIMGMALNVVSSDNQVTLMSNLFNDENNGFDAKQFSFMLGRDADDAVSELTIGGTSQARYDGSIFWSDLSDDNQGYWAIPVDDIVVNGQPLNFVGRNGAFDTGASRIFVPSADAEQIYANVEHEMIGGVYQLDCNIDITVSLRINGATWNMDRRDFVIEEEEGECYGAIIGSDFGSSNIWFLGTPFMKNVYSVFDLGNLQVGLAQLK